MQSRYLPSWGIACFAENQVLQKYEVNLVSDSFLFLLLIYVKKGWVLSIIEQIKIEIVRLIVGILFTLGHNLLFNNSKQFCIFPHNNLPIYLA